MSEKVTRTPPIVIMFQPTDFHVLREPDELLQWERLTSEKLGLASTGALTATSHSKTLSSCGSSGFDDTDMDDPF